MRKYCLSAMILSTAIALPATAQDRYLNFALRGGVSYGPEYPGASSYGPAPDLGITFGALKWGRVNAGTNIGDIPANGFALRGAFKVIGSREAADNPELTGLNDIDTAVEVGIGAVYRQTNWQAFGEIRKGVTGHSGVTGTLGADVIFRPDGRWTISVGPRISLGNDEFANTYFGVSAAESGASGLAAFDANGGALGAGIAAEATYRINDKWAASGLLSYEKLINDAGDSPVTSIGSDDQWRLRIGFSRAFTLRF